MSIEDRVQEILGNVTFDYSAVINKGDSLKITLPPYALKQLLLLVNEAQIKLCERIKLNTRGEDPDQYRPNDLIAQGYVEEIIDDEIAELRLLSEEKS
jgi:hypothetical protein